MSVINVYLTQGLSSHKPRNRKRIKSLLFFHYVYIVQTQLIRVYYVLFHFTLMLFV